MLLPLLAAGARQDRWEIVGPGGGGTMFYPTISPSDTSRVLLRCDMTGAYLTEDAGASWRMFNLRTTTSFFVFDPVDPHVIYDYSLGLWRSTDAGKTWSLVYPNPTTVTGIKIAGDHGEESIVTSAPSLGTMTALAVDPADSDLLYSVIKDTLYVSSDRGATWTGSTRLADGGSKVYVDPNSPSDNRTLYIVGRHTIAVREGGQWRSGTAPNGIAAFTDASLGFSNSGGAPVIYATADRIYVSEDAGSTWRDALLPQGHDTEFSAISASLFHGDTAYVSYSNLTETNGQYWFGVARSHDRGHTWNLVWKSANQSPANVADAWLPGAFGAGWAGNPSGLGVAPTDPDICYGTDSGRTMRTINGGKTWQAVYSAATPDGAYTTSGLDVTTSYGVHFDPFDANRMFITYTDVGLFRSETSGQSWIYSGTGVPSRWRNTTYWMEFDPAVPGRVWAATSRTHDLPRPKMWRSTDPSTFEGGIVISNDGGKTWRQSNTGMDLTATTHVLLDPSSPTEARVLYAAGFGRGVYKSVDGGQTWKLKNEGLDGVQPFAWRLALDPAGVLYLIVARRSENGSYGDANDGALYRSTDGAETWKKLLLPTGVNGPNGLAVDPDDPRRLYLAAWGRYNSQGDHDGGIFLSTDGGATWRNVLSTDQHVYDVTYDARTGTLYAAGFESSAWRSDDRGETWYRLRGYNFKWGHRVIPDPRDTTKVYITTFGGSVWHGPADGDPDAAEDIAGPATVMFTK
jgi:photosystem II stability/assembly factor-like uncharacterized protein